MNGSVSVRVVDNSDLTHKSLAVEIRQPNGDRIEATSVGFDPDNHHMTVVVARKSSGAPVENKRFVVPVNQPRRIHELAYIRELIEEAIRMSGFNQNQVALRVEQQISTIMTPQMTTFPFPGEPDVIKTHIVCFWMRVWYVPDMRQQEPLVVSYGFQKGSKAAVFVPFDVGVMSKNDFERSYGDFCLEQLSAQWRMQTTWTPQQTAFMLWGITAVNKKIPEEVWKPDGASMPPSDVQRPEKQKAVPEWEREKQWLEHILRFTDAESPQKKTPVKKKRPRTPRED